MAYQETTPRWIILLGSQLDQIQVIIFRNLHCLREYLILKFIRSPIPFGLSPYEQVTLGADVRCLNLFLYGSHLLTGLSYPARERCH